MTLDNLNRKTVLRTARDFDAPATTPLLISNLRHCYVYILACLAEITIKECSDSVIVAGVARMVTLENCTRCTVISITKSIKIQGCVDSTVHACVNTKPVLAHGNSGITLAPYNTFYSQLDAHIQQMGINTGLKDNFWNAPVDFTRTKSVTLLATNKVPNVALLEEKQPASYLFMNPDDFSPFVVPFQLPGNTKTNPVELATEYSQALQRKAKRVNLLKGAIASVPEALKDEVRRDIEDKFREWMVQSGNIDQVNDLINFHLQ